MTDLQLTVIRWACEAGAVTSLTYQDVRQTVALLATDKDALRATCTRVFASTPRSESGRSMARRLQERVESRLASRDRGAEIGRVLVAS